MPYIEQKERELIVDKYEVVDPVFISNPGQLNYALTILVRGYIRNKGLNYQTINDILGALEGCKLETYRRVASPYEDEKRKLNGDVFDI
jgi:hypothetical protein